MSRQIKFRAWVTYVGGHTSMFHINGFNFENGKLKSVWVDGHTGNIFADRVKIELMQFTGLHDKNLLKELYEGDIIDAEGNLKGNIYESPQIYEEGIDCLIEGMGTEKWRSTESIAVGRGCAYTK